jgi:hypothetical protein
MIAKFSLFNKTVSYVRNYFPSQMVIQRIPAGIPKNSDKFSVELKLFFRTKKLNPEENFQVFLNNFSSQPDNDWIISDRYLQRIIVDFFKELPQDTLEYFAKRPLVLVPVSAHLACAIGEKDALDIILLFPEMVKKLKSADPRNALAVLAHEIGHLYYRHSLRKIDRLQAQVEADRFACQMGYGLELVETLENFPDIDTRVRITYITAEYFSSKKSA